MPKDMPKLRLDADLSRIFLSCAPEIYIFYACLDVVKAIWEVESKVNANKIDGRAFVKQVGPLFSQLWGLSEATQRFDVVAPFTPNAGFSPSFWRWFNWWNDLSFG